jgi:integrase
VAYRIQKRSWKKADGTVTESWRLIIDDYTSGEAVSSYPDKASYWKLGFDPNASYEDAKATLKVIQARNKISRAMERKAKLHAERIKAEQIESAYLPQHLYRSFLSWLKEKRLWDELPEKVSSHLLCMRKIVQEVNACPSTWPDSPEKIYRYFLRNKLSISYIQKVLPLINEYGFFYCREMGKPFLPISMPRGDMAQKIDNTNHNARNGKQAPSKPILPAHLSALQSLPPEQLRWVRAAVFFGLRPFEVDRLNKRNLDKDSGWKISKDENGTYILHFYQHKLVRVTERARRWKRIPCILPEQIEILDELHQGLPTKRPYCKTLQSHLGAGVGLYGGRKAFEKLMRSKGQDFRNISRWLGHTDVNRTERNYRETEAVEYAPIKDPA